MRCVESVAKGGTRAETAWWCARCGPKERCFASSAASGWVRESFSAEVQERAMMGSSFRSVEPVGPSAGRGLRVVEGCDAEANPFPH